MRKNKFFILCFLCCFCFSCAAAEKTPYQISGEMVMDRQVYGENSTFLFSLYNNMEKKITCVTIVFYLFDEDGNSPLYGKGNVVLTVPIEIGSHENVTDSVSLDNFLSELPEDPYDIGFLYVSKIIYEDGEIWTDPFGVKIGL